MGQGFDSTVEFSQVLVLLETSKQLQLNKLGVSESSQIIFHNVSLSVLHESNFKLVTRYELRNRVVVLEKWSFVFEVEKHIHRVAADLEVLYIQSIMQCECRSNKRSGKVIRTSRFLFTFLILNDKIKVRRT